MIEEKAKLFKALSDPNRLRILKMLQAKKLCVCEITYVLDLAPSTVSEHLSILKRSEFILEEKDGKWVNYMINPRPSDPVVGSILSMLPFWINDTAAADSGLERIDSADRNEICCR